jgi:hypothetical protein
MITALPQQERLDRIRALASFALICLPSSLRNVTKSVRFGKVSVMPAKSLVSLFSRVIFSGSFAVRVKTLAF